MCERDLAGAEPLFSDLGDVKPAVLLMILTRFVETMGGGVTGQKEGGYFAAGRRADQGEISGFA